MCIVIHTFTQILALPFSGSQTLATVTFLRASSQCQSSVTIPAAKYVHINIALSCQK